MQALFLSRVKLFWKWWKWHYLTLKVQYLFFPKGILWNCSTVTEATILICSRSIIFQFYFSMFNSCIKQNLLIINQNEITTEENTMIRVNPWQIVSITIINQHKIKINNNCNILGYYYWFVNCSKEKLIRTVRCGKWQPLLSWLQSDSF